MIPIGHLRMTKTQLLVSRFGDRLAGRDYGSTFARVEPKAKCFCVNDDKTIAPIRDINA